MNFLLFFFILKTIVHDIYMYAWVNRQRILNPQNTVFSLAEKYLPRELLQEIRMPVQGGVGAKKRKRAAAAAAGRSSSKLKGKGKARALDDGVEEE